MVPFDHLEQRLLHSFPRHVASDRGVLGFAADFVDFVDIDDAALGALDIPGQSRSRREPSRISFGVGMPSRDLTGADLVSSRMISLHSSTHSSQMNTVGPAMSLRTSCWLFRQKEQ
jgi:hypothetical protein